MFEDFVEEVVVGDDLPVFVRHRLLPGRMGAENAAECRAAVCDPAVVRGMLEDYRAGLTVDADEERGPG